MNQTRRRCIHGAVLAGLAPLGLLTRAARAAPEPEALLRRGGAGLVVLMRHASAPGTYDPPGFRLGECSTQRNLGDEGRAQATSIGAWYREKGLTPVAVRTSQWCRCQDTARLAFGAGRDWPQLNSIVRDAERGAAQTNALRGELARLATANAAGFEVWVTHQVNIAELTGNFTNSGDAVLVHHEPESGRSGAGRVAVLATLRIG